MNENALNKTEIISRAKLKWDRKDNDNKLKAGSKYKHFLNKFNFDYKEWTNDFERLSVIQQNIIIKGELIRTYDSLPNIDKTHIMNSLGLSTFSSKWYKLPSVDKKILLNYVIK